MSRVDPIHLLTAILAIGCGLAYIHVLSVVPLHVPLDPDEGWNAVFAELVRTTGSPYPPRASLLTDNYPPLSFFAIAALPVDDAIVAGRLVASASLAAVCALIVLIARQLGAGRIPSLLGGLFFVAWIMLATDYAGMNDPQMLGHAIALCGLAVVLRGQHGMRALVAGAVLFAAAVFVKHNLVVLPLAVCVWLAAVNRKAAIIFAITGAVSIGAGFLGVQLALHENLLSRIVSPRAYSLIQMFRGLWDWLVFAWAPLVCAAFLFAFRRDRATVFPLIYAGIAIVAGVFFLGGDGVDANAMFDAGIALSLSVAVALHHVDGTAKSALASILFIPLVTAPNFEASSWTDGSFWLSPLRAERADAEIAYIAARPGPALCEDLSLCYWANKHAEADLFNLIEAVKTGARPATILTNSLATRRYATIDLDLNSALLDVPALSAPLRRHYRMVWKNDDRVLYVPR